jgi:N utilization substance protein B
VAVRPETRARALAIQLLYAWDVRGAGAGGRQQWEGLAELSRVRVDSRERGTELAGMVVERRAELDRHIAAAADHWRVERLGVVERSILRLAVLELLLGATPPKVVIDEALSLAHWFAGERSPAFVNGVLDRVARELGRL